MTNLPLLHSEQQALTANTAGRVEKLNIFGPAPVVGGEQVEAYDELCARISGAVKPSDFIEEIWVFDITNLVWEMCRWRRFAMELWRDRNQHQGIDNIERINRLIANAELRRNAVLREIDRHRAVVGERLRAVVTQVDAEFTVVQQAKESDVA
jgi:hypothetical protein